MINIHYLVRVPYLIILAVSKRDRIVADIAKSVNITYPYASKMVHFLEDSGYIKTEKIGRNRFCSITAKGKKVSYSLVEFKKYIGEK